MTVYIAAGFDSRLRVQWTKLCLWLANIDVLCGWLDEDTNASAETCAVRDLAEIDQADFVMLLADTPSTTGGMHFEAGYAYSKDKLIVIGKSKNVFYSLPLAQRFETVSDFIRWYKETIKEYA